MTRTWRDAQSRLFDNQKRGCTLRRKLKKRTGLRAIAAVTAAVAAASLLAACGSDSSSSSSSGDSASTYKIAVVAGITGPAAAVLKGEIAGAQAYVSVVNKNGGINGHKLALVTADTKSEATTSCRADDPNDCSGQASGSDWRRDR